MKDFAAKFLEWHADHFGDFSPEINAELLCLANEAEAVSKEQGSRDGDGEKA